MLPKSMRVTKTLFPELLRKGAFCSTPSLSLRFAPKDKLPSLCSVVVSKKSAGSAVLRNRIKRRISAAIELFLNDKRYKAPSTPFACAIFAKAGVEKLSPSDLVDEVGFLLKKAKLV